MIPVREWITRLKNKLTGNKVLFEVGEKEDNNDLWWKLLEEKSEGKDYLCCPMCGSGLRSGPSGGAAQNLICSDTEGKECGMTWWFAPILRIIHPV